MVADDTQKNEPGVEARSAHGQAAPITVILERSAGGDRLAADQLMPLVYAQLRGAAQEAMRQERGGGAGHTLSATALVHEAYLKLVGPQGGKVGGVAGQGPTFAGRGHFYAAAAQAMRQHLIDHARGKLAEKRGGRGRGHAAEEGEGGEAVDRGTARERAPRRVPIEHLREVADLAMIENPEQIVSLDAALCRLELEDPHTAAVVRLRFFAGLTIE